MLAWGAEQTLNGGQRAEAIGGDVEGRNAPTGVARFRLAAPQLAPTRPAGISGGNHDRSRRHHDRVPDHPHPRRRGVGGLGLSLRRVRAAERGGDRSHGRAVHGGATGEKEAGRSTPGVRGPQIGGGAVLYWRAWDAAGSFGDWIGSRFGAVLTVGAVAAIAAFVIGLFATRPSVRRLLALGRRIAQSEGPPAPCSRPRWGACRLG